jgi:hypothetical protein
MTMDFPALTKFAALIALAGIAAISCSLFAARHGAALAGYAL